MANCLASLWSAALQWAGPSPWSSSAIFVLWEMQGAQAWEKTPSFVHNACSRAAPIPHLSLHPEWNISSSLFLLTRKIAFSSLCLIWATNTAMNMLSSRKKENKYVQVSLLLFVWACVCLSTGKHKYTHILQLQNISVSSAAQFQCNYKHPCSF